MKHILCIVSIGVVALACRAGVVVDAQSAGAPLNHYWSVGVGAGRVNEGLRVGWHEHLRDVGANCGFRYVRMHDTFNDDMFVCFPKEKRGTGSGERIPRAKRAPKAAQCGVGTGMVYSWQYIDDVYDRMLAEGVRPFVEFSFFPSCLAAEGTRRQMWYRNCVTIDRAKLPQWGELCEAFVRHVVERYGLDEVKKWYFEVWNEPNLYNGFFEGTRSDYFELYRVSAQAVKRVSPELKVGGPATSNFIADARHDGEIQDNQKSVFYPQETINDQKWKGVWIEEFLAFAAKEKLPVDFISCHPYPTDYALDPVSGRGKDAIRYVHSLRDDIDWLVKVRNASAFPNAEIHLTEWSTSPSSRDPMHDRLPPCAYIAKAVLENTGKVDSLMYWTFTDVFEEKGGGEEIFHGSFGLVNFQGIHKPTYHAFRMMNALGDEVIYNADPVVVTRDSKRGKIAALAYAYPKEFACHVPASRDCKNFMKASPTELDLTLTGLKPNAVFMVETLDEKSGNACGAWEAMGRPHSPNRDQLAALKVAADATKREEVKADASGTLVIKRTLAPWTMMLISEK